MAGILTSNSPTPGYIAWRSFSLTVEDDIFTFPASNTNKKLVWWIYGSTTLTVGDVLPSTLTDMDCLLFANRSGFAINATTATALNGDLIVPGTIVAEGIAADAIKASHLDTGSVTADAIGVKEIYATHMSSGAITTSALSVGSLGDNLVANGSFEDISSGVVEGWIATAAVSGTITPVTGVSSSGAVAVQLDATSTTTSNLRFSQALDKLIPVSSVLNRRWYIAARMGSSVAITRGVYLRVAWFDANKVALSTGGTTDVLSNAPMSTTFDVREGQVTPPALAKYMRLEVFLLNPNVVAKLYVDEITAREVVVSAQISDGAIIATHITASAELSAKVGSFLEVTAGMIKADAIDGKSILGALFKTNATAGRGIEINGLLTNNFIRGYDANGLVTFSVDGNNGDVVLKGKLTSGSTIEGSLFQTSDQLDTGIKIDGRGGVNSFKAYGGGKETFGIDGNTGSVSMVGEFSNGFDGNTVTISKPFASDGFMTSNIRFSQGSTPWFSKLESESVNPEDVGTGDASWGSQLFMGSYNDMDGTYATVSPSTTTERIGGTTAFMAAVNLRAVSTDLSGGGGTVMSSMYLGSQVAQPGGVLSAGITLSTGRFSVYSDNFTADPYRFGMGVTDGIIETPRLHLSALDDVSETSTLHAFQIGESTTSHIKMDTNEIVGMGSGGTNGASIYVPYGFHVDYNTYSMLGEGYVMTLGTYKDQIDANYLGTSALDTITTTGDYYQNQNVQATILRDYPVTLAGLLEVRSVASASFFYQRYTTYGSSNRMFTRGLYNGTWSAWSEVMIARPWINAILLNGWAEYTAFGSTVGYRISGDQVQLKGVVRYGTVGSATPIFRMNTGHWPGKGMLLSANYAGAGVDLRVDPDGDVYVSSGTPGWVNLDGVSFTIA